VLLRTGQYDIQFITIYNYSRIEKVKNIQALPDVKGGLELGKRVY